MRRRSGGCSDSCRTTLSLRRSGKPHWHPSRMWRAQKSERRSSRGFKTASYDRRSSTCSASSSSSSQWRRGGEVASARGGHSESEDEGGGGGPRDEKASVPCVASRDSVHR